MSDAELLDAADRVDKFLRERARLLGPDPELINGLHYGDPEREASLNASDLQRLVDEARGNAHARR